MGCSTLVARVACRKIARARGADGKALIRNHREEVRSLRHEYPAIFWHGFIIGFLGDWWVPGLYFKWLAKPAIPLSIIERKQKSHGFSNHPTGDRFLVIVKAVYSARSTIITSFPGRSFE